MTERKKQSPLKRPYYVFDNIKDFIQNVSFGCGLATLLCHNKTNRRSRAILQPEKFVEYANASLPEDEQTNLDELQDLIRCHHPDHDAPESLNELTFLLDYDSEGNATVAENDPYISRIMQIRNAYVQSHNEWVRSEFKDDETINANLLNLLTLEEALSLAVPQTAVLEGETANFNISDILNVDVMLKNDSSDYTSSIMTSGLFTTIFALVAHANNLMLQNPQKKTYISTELLDKYFNGTDLNYLPGLSTIFYLGGRSVLPHPEIANIDFGDPDWDAVMDEVKDDIKDDYPLTANDPVAMERLALKYISMYMTNPNTDTPYTGLTAIDAMRSESKNPDTYIPAEGNDPAGIKPYAATVLLYNYKIPDDLLDVRYRRMLTPPANNPIAQSDNKIVMDKLNRVKDYFLTLNDVHIAYLRAIEKARALRIRLPSFGTRTLRTQRQQPQEDGDMDNMGEDGDMGDRFAEDGNM